MSPRSAFGKSCLTNCSISLGGSVPFFTCAAISSFIPSSRRAFPSRSHCPCVNTGVLSAFPSPACGSSSTGTPAGCSFGAAPSVCAACPGVSADAAFCVSPPAASAFSAVWAPSWRISAFPCPVPDSVPCTITVPSSPTPFFVKISITA